MGNRAVITDESKGCGIYIHWNGGIDSVKAFVKYCELRGFRGFPDNYGVARLTQVIANYFGGDLSIGVVGDPLRWVDGCDNGLYVIKGWQIVGHYRNDRSYKEYNVIKLDEWGEEEREGYDILEMIIDIDKKQPKEDQLGRDHIIEVLGTNMYEEQEKNPDLWYSAYEYEGDEEEE